MVADVFVFGLMVGERYRIGAGCWSGEGWALVVIRNAKQVAQTQMPCLRASHQVLSVPGSIGW